MPIHRVAGIGSNKDFDQGLSITGSNNTVAAVGNWWIPNAQGAGQDGTYDTRQTLTSGEGPNIYSSDIGVTIDL
jgi:hypothetical protein